MIPPAFWRHRGVASTLLWPLAGLYRLAARRCTRDEGAACGVPVICVGNITTGGTGKTPVVLSLIARLSARGHTPHALTRGYGGGERGPVRVQPGLHTAADVGDEALLLAAQAPTWVARERIRGAEAAVRAKADVIVMDDGFQNPSLKKNLSLVVVDGGYGFGNGRLIPAGPLREPLAAGLARADALIIIGDDDTNAAETVRKRMPDLPILQAQTRPRGDYAHLAGVRVFAFAGIGRPKKFFDTLRALGADVVQTRTFADHHAFTHSDMAALRAQAHKQKARLITTEKDLVRLSPSDRTGIEAVGIELVFSDEAAINALLDTVTIKKGTGA